jgi:hypothetical protein
MPPGRRTILEIAVIVACLLWLAGWLLFGAIVATDASQVRLGDNQGRKSLAVFGIFAGIGAIALIGLWPHRDLLRGTRPEQSTSRGFEVKPKPDIMGKHVDREEHQGRT